MRSLGRLPRAADASSARRDAQRHLAQVAAVVERQVEHEVRRSPRCAALSIAFCSALKSGTPSSSMTTISPSSQPESMPSDSIAAASGFILSVQSWPPRVISRRLALVDARHQPIAVELGLDDPVAGRRRRDERRELRLELRRQAARALRGREVGRSAAALAAARARVGTAARLALLDQAERLGDDAVGQRGDHVVFGERARPRVLLLEQHPRVLLVARLGDAHQLPEAGELLAVQAKDQLALAASLRADRPRAPTCRGPRRSRCRRRTGSAGSFLRSLRSRADGPRRGSPSASSTDRSDGPFGTAQLSRTPSSSRRKS